MNEEDENDIDFKLYRERKIQLLHDIFKLVQEVHNEQLLHAPDIIGILEDVKFDYQMQLRHNRMTIETKKDNDDRGLFV